MKELIDKITKQFLEHSKGKPIRIISHFDTDGITSASILIKTFKRLDLKFSVNIVKGLDEQIIKAELKRQPKEIIIFSDLASGSLQYFQNLRDPIYILDHHEPNKEKLNDNIRMINPHLTDDPKNNDCTGAGVCYLFSKALSEDNQDISKIAIIGLIGDRHETNLSKINQEIINDTKDLTIKKGLTLYPATRALKRTLEYSTSPYIPGVTGSGEGVVELLKETEIDFDKSLLDLTEEEMGRLLTAITIRKASNNSSEDIIGNLFILNFFTNSEDVREISTLINACSRLGNHDIAISYCLESPKAKTKALDIYTKYKQELVRSLKVTEQINKIKGENFEIINAQDQIKSEIIGTICSMLSSASSYNTGTVIIAMAYTTEDKLKVSARIVGENGRNLKHLLEKTVAELKGEHPDTTVEVGGHEVAAGCLLEIDLEEAFIKTLRRNLEIEIVKV
ncbi:MAG: single-stranded-DNA-specific exonuclease [Patescibacteria group bacterium]|jgi:single-stranded-DNA-specific exonuclease